MNALQVSLMWFGFFVIIMLGVIGILMFIVWISDTVSTFASRVKHVFNVVEGGTLVTKFDSYMEMGRIHSRITAEYMDKLKEEQVRHDNNIRSLNAYINFLDKEQKKRVDAIVKQTNENIISSATIAANIAYKHNELVEYVDEEVEALYEEIDRVDKKDLNMEVCEDIEETIAEENVECLNS